MDLPNFLYQTDAGDIRLTGSRIGLYHVVREYQDRATAEQIALEYPTLPLVQVEQVIEFYLANRAAVDAYVREYEAELERQRAAGQHLDVDKLRARLAAIRNGQPSGDG